MVYLICSVLLSIGLLGLIAQVVLGGGGRFGHSAPHAVGHQAGASHLPGAGAHHGSHSDMSSRGSSFWLSFLSPLAFFAVCVGSGATGLLLKPLHWPALLVAVAALAGGFLFHSLFVRQIFKFVLRFASTPSTLMEGAISHSAQAMTSFNAAGKGLVKLNVDGQIVQVLATLETDDRADAGLVVPGDNLTVTSVDGHTNTCRVARL